MDYHHKESLRDRDIKLKKARFLLSHLCQLLVPGNYIVHVCRSVSGCSRPRLERLKSVNADASKGFTVSDSAVTVFHREGFLDKYKRYLLRTKDSENIEIDIPVAIDIPGSKMKINLKMISYAQLELSIREDYTGLPIKITHQELENLRREEEFIKPPDSKGGNRQHKKSKKKPKSKRKTHKRKTQRK